jgi:hypothetical protein
MTVEAVAAIGAVVTAGSLVLLAFGFDSVIVPAFSCGAFRSSCATGKCSQCEPSATSSRIGGALLFVLAQYVTAAAAWHLWKGSGEEFSWSLPLPPCVGWRGASLL